MKIHITAALVGLALAGTVSARSVLPQTTAPRMSLDGVINPLPPLPPGCINDGRMPPAPPTPPPFASKADWSSLGLNQAQVARVGRIFAHQAAKMSQLEQQRRQLDTSTCLSLRKAVGARSLAQWAAATPPPPPMPGANGHPAMPPPPPSPPPFPTSHPKRKLDAMPGATD